MRLTFAEQLFTQRRRRQEDQHQAAKRCGISHHQYVQLERGIVAVGDSGRIVGRRVKDLAWVDLKPNEQCVILRRRAGLTLKQTAKKLGRCKLWVNKMELGEVPCDELLEYWKHGSLRG